MVLAFYKHIPLRFTASFQSLCAAQVSRSIQSAKTPLWKGKPTVLQVTRCTAQPRAHPPPTAGAWCCAERTVARELWVGAELRETKFRQCQMMQRVPAKAFHPPQQLRLEILWICTRGRGTDQKMRNQRLRIRKAQQFSCEGGRNAERKITVPPAATQIVSDLQE